mgnify:CR=1 FL=1
MQHVSLKDLEVIQTWTYVSKFFVHNFVMDLSKTKIVFLTNNGTQSQFCTWEFIQDTVECVDTFWSFSITPNVASISPDNIYYAQLSLGGRDHLVQFNITSGKTLSKTSPIIDQTWEIHYIKAQTNKHP